MLPQSFVMRIVIGPEGVVAQAMLVGEVNSDRIILKDARPCSGKCSLGSFLSFGNAHMRYF